MHLIVILISALFALVGVAMVLRGARGGWVFTLIGAIPGIVAVISILLDWFQASQEFRYKVEIVGNDVICRRSDGEFESVCWKDLKSVSAFGAHLEGYTLLLSDSKSGCAVPDSADGIEKLLTRMKSLPGFDYGGITAAAMSPEREEYLCWELRTSSDHAEQLHR
jgi:hypothetical protein